MGVLTIHTAQKKLRLGEVGSQNRDQAEWGRLLLSYRLHKRTCQCEEVEEGGRINRRVHLF